MHVLFSWICVFCGSRILEALLAHGARDHGTHGAHGAHWPNIYIYIYIYSNIEFIICIDYLLVSGSRDQPHCFGFDNPLYAEVFMHLDL